MTKRSYPNVKIIDLAPDLWIWRLEHPSWHEDADWQEIVTCVCVDAADERWLLDPLLPPDDATQFWDRFADRPPTVVAVLSPDNMRRTWSNRQTKSYIQQFDVYGTYQVKKKISIDDISLKYRSQYQHTKTRVMLDIPDTKMVLNKETCFMGGFVYKNSDKIVVVSVIDNLMKGAASQAVKNMRFMLNLSLSQVFFDKWDT